MAKQEQFQENVSEWIKVMNERMSRIEEQIADLSGCVEEDLITLTYQYRVIKDLRKIVMKLEYDSAIKNKIIMALKNKL